MTDDRQFHTPNRMQLGCRCRGYRVPTNPNAPGTQWLLAGRSPRHQHIQESSKAPPWRYKRSTTKKTSRQVIERCYPRDPRLLHQQEGIRRYQDFRILPGNAQGMGSREQVVPRERAFWSETRYTRPTKGTAPPKLQWPGPAAAQTTGLYRRMAR